MVPENQPLFPSEKRGLSRYFLRVQTVLAAVGSSPVCALVMMSSYGERRVKRDALPCMAKAERCQRTCQARRNVRCQGVRVGIVPRYNLGFWRRLKRVKANLAVCERGESPVSRRLCPVKMFQETDGRFIHAVFFIVLGRRARRSACVSLGSFEPTAAVFVPGCAIGFQRCS